MANNIFTGTFYNENVAKITGSVVRYFGIHRNNQGVLSISDTRVAEDDMYNFNLIDADWLGNSVPFIDGEQIAIIAWENESLDLQSTDITRFSMIYFPHDGRDTYVQNIQLLPKTNPTCNLTYTAGKVGDVITFNSNGNDLYQWEFETMTHYHRDNIFGSIVSPVGISSVEYDYGSGWVTTNQHTFTTPGTYTIITRVTNNFGLVSTCQQDIEILSSAPTGCITFDKTEPIINEVVNVLACINDPGGVIVDVDHIWDDVLVEINTNLTFNYDKTLLVNKTYVAKQIITWYDGFTNQELFYTKSLSMGNIPPEFNIVEEIIGDPVDNHYKFTASDIVDPDGDDATVAIKWMVEFKTPIDDKFKIVYNPGYPATINTDPKEWIFSSPGLYRITVTAKDILGATTTHSVEVLITVESGCNATGTIKLNNNKWQLISIPVTNVNVANYFMEKVKNTIITYDVNLDASDVIEVASAYPSCDDKFLSYIPGYTKIDNINNFELVRLNGVNLNEIVGFWVKCKDFKLLTNDEDIIIDWSQSDTVV